MVLLLVKGCNDQHWAKKQVEERGSELPRPALESHPAVGVPLTLRLAACDSVGVRREAVLASADGVPSLHAACCPRTTGCWAAGVSLGRCQNSRVGILVRLAAAIDGAWEGDESGDTLAYGVALEGVQC